MAGVDAESSVYVGNLCLSTPLADMEDLIYELFLQAGPLEKVYIPYDKDNGRHKGYGFVEFQHTESVQYSIDLLHGIHLCGRPLKVNKVLQRSNTSEPSQLLSTSSATVVNTSSVSSLQPQCVSQSNHQYLTFDTAHLATTSPSTTSIPSLFPSMSATQVNSKKSIPSLFPPRQTQPAIFNPPGAMPGSMNSTGPIPSMNSAQASIPSLFPMEYGPSCYNEPTRFSRAVVHAEKSTSRMTSYYDNTHHRLHESRLVANDYPSWFKPQVKEKMAQYHLNMLENKLQGMKSAMSHMYNNSSHPINSSNCNNP